MLRIELSAGFLFFLALLAHWDAGGVFWPYLAAAALHEAAHIAAICAFGGRVHSLRLGFGDAQLQTGLLPERALFWCAAAGPAECIRGRYAPAEAPPRPEAARKCAASTGVFLRYRRYGCWLGAWLGSVP